MWEIERHSGEVKASRFKVIMNMIYMMKRKIKKRASSLDVR